MLVKFNEIFKNKISFSFFGYEEELNNTLLMNALQIYKHVAMSFRLVINDVD